ncbi:N-acetylmuramoyl-L-alanine amidase [Nocardia sp. NPDC001965]
MKDPTTRVQLSPNRHSGGRNVSWVAVHTQEGNGSAASLTNYLCNPSSQVSYNAVVDDEEIVLVVPWGENPWSASDANSRADHICLAGTFVRWSRGKWLETDDSDGVNEDLMLTQAAEVAAWRCITRGIPIEYVGGGDIPPDRPGICGHRDFGQWGGGHTDPGPNFPWDEFIRRAKNFAAGLAGDDELMGSYINHKGEKTDAMVGLSFIDKHVGLILDQLGGAGTRDGANFPGWKDQLGGDTLVEAVGKLLPLTKKVPELETKIDKILALLEKTPKS